MKLHIRFLLVSLLFTTQYVVAVEMKGLFETEVVVASQAREDRNIALREALIIVLSRVAAGKELMVDPAVKNALNNAASYVDQYQYALIAGGTGTHKSRKMRVSFNESALMDLMRRSGLAVWNEVRDEVLLWIVIEQNRRQVLLDTEQDTDFNHALQQAARLKGIPILLPLMDLEEKQAVAVEDIVSAYPEKLLAASSRYDVAAILSAKVVQQGKCWRSEWTLNFNNKIEQWRVPCEQLEANLSTAFEGVYDHLAAYYAVKPGLIGAGNIRLKISGVNNKKAEAGLKSYLQQLPMVKSVKRVEHKQSRYVVQLKITGTKADLQKYIVLGRELREKGLDMHDNSLLYELIVR